MGKLGVLTATAFAVFLTLASPVFAGEDISSEQVQPDIQGTTSIGDSERMEDPTAAIYWHFITCVHDAHECLHEAEHHGYEHYKVSHDHRQCGHHDVACYGGHH